MQHSDVRIASIDFGKRKMGLAISDPSKSLSLPLPTLFIEQNLSLPKVIEKIITAFKEYRIESIVIGHPIEMKGNSGKMAKEVENFAVEFEKLSGFKTILWDERLTSKQADQTLKQENIKRKKRDLMNDSLASSLLLQSYLDYLALQKSIF